MHPDLSSCAYSGDGPRSIGCSRDWRQAIKRVIDILVAGSGLVLLTPLMGLIAVAIALTSPGPIFYRWPVVGLGGRPLRSFKFRTMVQDADRMKQDLLQYNESSGPVFKMRQDPRVTRVGRVLRKFSLDELPQLWNILKGDMSLVGPRPVLSTEWERFTAWERQKLSAKPGAVCLWHVRGQPRDFHQWISLDIEYITTWSLWLDTKILLGAIWYMVSGKNV
jgi:lipopolysaccharide/colanic/teichoic acid biosynthesis glycosyltransferase